MTKKSPFCRPLLRGHHPTHFDTSQEPPGNEDGIAASAAQLGDEESAIDVNDGVDGRGHNGEGSGVTKRAIALWTWGINILQSSKISVEILFYNNTRTYYGTSATLHILHFTIKLAERKAVLG